MFITLTLPSYGRVVRGQGGPIDPARYDYRRAALDAMHFAKLVDRWVQNLRRGAGFKVQYFAAIEPQRRLAPHVHVAMRGAIQRQVIRQVTRGTYFQLWWPSFDVPRYVHRSPVFTDGAYRDPDTHQELKTWEQALVELDQNPDAQPAHVMRLGSQVDVKGILAGSKDADRTIGYLTKYLAKSMAAPMGDGQESGSPAAQHHDRLAAEVRWLPCIPNVGTGCATEYSPRTLAPGCPPTCERVWTAEETSQFLGVPVSTLHQWRYFAKGPNAFRVGRHLRYDPDAVRLWLVEQCVGEAG